MGCKGTIERGITSYIVTLVEGSVSIASAAATHRHLQASGWRFTDASAFHIAHSFFAVFYVIYRVIVLVNEDICDCDLTALMYIVYIGAFVWMCEIFVRFWKRVTIPTGGAREPWQLRSAFYAIGFATQTTSYCYDIFSPGNEAKLCPTSPPLLLKAPRSATTFRGNLLLLTLGPCEPQLFGIVAGFIVIFVFGVDSAVLAASCYERACEHKTTSLSSGSPDDTKFSRAMKLQALLFAGIPISMTIGGVLYVSSITKTRPEALSSLDGQVGIFMVPSILMLYLMWERYVISSLFASLYQIHRSSLVSPLPNTHKRTEIILDLFRPTLRTWRRNGHFLSRTRLWVTIFCAPQLPLRPSSRSPPAFLCNPSSRSSPSNPIMREATSWPH